jgi:hypothetical protein
VKTSVLEGAVIGLALAAAAAAMAFALQRANQTPPPSSAPATAQAGHIRSPVRRDAGQAASADRAAAADSTAFPGETSLESTRQTPVRAGLSSAVDNPQPPESRRIRVEPEDPQTGQPEELTREQILYAVRQTERDIAQTRVEIDAMEREFLEAGGETYGGEALFDGIEALPEVVRVRIAFLKDRLRNEWRREALRQAKLERFRNALGYSR